MKFFIAILSLLFGIMIGAGITTFLVVKKNQTVQNYLCKEGAINVNEEKKAGVSGFLNSYMIEKFKKDSNLEIDEKKLDEIKSKNNDISEGPGGCKNENECLDHCSKLENLQECIGFAKKYLGDSEEKK